jgi:hypothetical protein
VALRDAPTLRHYDPELVEYWVSADGRGTRRELDRHTPLPVETEFSWGLIRITDRLDVTNEYVTFGGTLSAAEVDGMTVADFTSPAPLLRRGGHSQGWDHGAASLAAFFGRLIIAVDFTPGFEALAASVDPITRYAAFIRDLVGRYRRSPILRDQHLDLWVLLQSGAPTGARPPDRVGRRATPEQITPPGTDRLGQPRASIKRPTAGAMPRVPTTVLAVREADERPSTPGHPDGQPHRVPEGRVVQAARPVRIHAADPSPSPADEPPDAGQHPGQPREATDVAGGGSRA